MTARNGTAIGIDGYNLALPYGTGVATYGRTLIQAVRELGWSVDLVYGIPVAADAPHDLRETLFYGRLSEETGHGGGLSKALGARIRRALLTPEPRELLEIPSTGRVITDGFGDRVPPFDRLLTRGGLFSVCARYFRRYGRFMPVRMERPPTIMHWTYPLPLRMIGAANVYTIHDLVPLRLPHTSLEDKRYYQALIGACLRSAVQIVTVSEASRRDILDLFDVDERRVTNTYQAFQQPDAVTDDADLAVRLDRLFDLRRDGYLLFFGAIEPKKNLGRLIEAYLQSQTTTPLIIVGGGGWRSEQELRLLRGGTGTSLAGVAQIRQIDYLPRRMLLDLIRGARGVLFPSLYEGFGLPALEAMALGAPLLAGRTSSLPEVVGDAAVYVDPYNVDDMAAQVKRLDEDDVLRKRLRSEGPVRAQLFSSLVYSQRIKQVYREILDRR